MNYGPPLDSNGNNISAFVKAIEITAKGTASGSASLTSEPGSIVPGLMRVKVPLSIPRFFFFFIHSFIQKLENSLPM